MAKSIDPLIAELNGKKGISDSNVITGPEESTKDRLDVTPAKSTGPTIQKSNAQHAIKSGGKGYRVVVAGDFYRPAKEGKGKVIDRYELAFNLPHLDGALGMIVGKLLLPMLKKHYPGALGYRTHEIKTAEPLTPDTPPTNSLQFMDRTRLERYIDDNSVPINPEQYDDVVTLREAVIDHKLNPKGFEQREARKQAERAELKELHAMNPDLAEAA